MKTLKFQDTKTFPVCLRTSCSSRCSCAVVPRLRNASDHGTGTRGQPVLFANKAKPALKLLSDGGRVEDTLCHENPFGDLCARCQGLPKARRQWEDSCPDAGFQFRKSMSMTYAVHVLSGYCITVMI